MYVEVAELGNKTSIDKILTVEAHSIYQKNYRKQPLLEMYAPPT